MTEVLSTSSKPVGSALALDRAADSAKIDRAKIESIVTPIVAAQGGEVVDIEWKPEAGGWVLRVYVEKLGASAKKLSTKDAAVTLELCANVARELSPALDADEALIPHAYNLEVSSPGVERPLKKAGDFARFVGEKAKIWLKKAALPRGADTGNGSRVVEGRLTSFTLDLRDPGGHGERAKIVLVDGSRTYDILFADVDRARLVYELETGTKRPKGGAKPKHGAAENRDKSASGRTGRDRTNAGGEAASKKLSKEPKEL